MTLRDIEAAILWGDTGEPAPYQLHHYPGRQNPIVVGTIYTPYVRVALAARAARQSGVILNRRGGWQLHGAIDLVVAPAPVSRVDPQGSVAVGLPRHTAIP